MFSRALVGTVLVAWLSAVGAADGRVEYAARWIEKQIAVPELAHVEYCVMAKPEMADALGSQIAPFKAAAATAALELAPRYANSLRVELAMRSDPTGADAAARANALSLARQAPADAFCRLLLRRLRRETASHLAEIHGRVLDDAEARMKRDFPNGLPPAAAPRAP
jgi:hypothetical protein